MKKITLSILILLILAFASLQAESSSTFDAGVYYATKKLLPSTPMNGAKQIELFAAQNEWEAFQVMIRSIEALEGINAALSDFADGKGNIIAASNAKFYREHYLNIVEPSNGGVTNHERAAGLYPDPLIPFTDPYKEGNVPVGAPFNLAANETGAIFIDIRVPTETPPGKYTGKLTVTASGKEPAVFDIIINVWEFAVPKERNVATAFGYGGGAPRGFHGGPAGDPKPGYDEIWKRYFQSMHEHRIDPQDAGDKIEFKFDADGKLIPPDFSKFDAAAAPFVDGTMFDDGAGMARFNVDYFRPGSGQGSMTEEQWGNAASALADHLEAKGWMKKVYLYSVDEPWMNGGDAAFKQIAKDVDILVKYNPLWKNKPLVTGPFQEQIAGRMGIWCPVTPMYEKWFYDNKPDRSVYAARLAMGEELWFYVCNANFPPYAGYDIDTAIGYEPRIVKWGSWYEGATGFLYWRMSYWVDDDPWNVWRNVKAFTSIGARNGDGFLFYPGDHDGTAGGKGSPAGISIDGPIVSYRMKQIRDGLEDWEMFITLDKLGGRDYAKKQVSRAYTQFGNFFIEDCEIEKDYCPDREPWTLDENVLLDARKKIAEKILYLKYPTKYPDPEAPAADGDVDSGDDEIEAENEETAKKTDSSGGCGGAGTPLTAFVVLAAILSLRNRKR